MNTRKATDDNIDVMLWDIQQAAAATGLSVHTLYAWVSQKRIAYVKAGRRVMFDPNDIKQWIDENKVLPVSMN